MRWRRRVCAGPPAPSRSWTASSSRAGRAPSPVGAAKRARPGCPRRLAQHLEQGLELRSVARPGSVDRLLREVVARHVERVDPVHLRAPRRGWSPSASTRAPCSRSQPSSLGVAVAARRAGRRRPRRAAPSAGAAGSTSARRRKNRLMSTRPPRAGGAGARAGRHRPSAIAPFGQAELGAHHVAIARIMDVQA